MGAISYQPWPFTAFFPTCPLQPAGIALEVPPPGAVLHHPHLLGQRQGCRHHLTQRGPCILQRRIAERLGQQEQTFHEALVKGIAPSWGTKTKVWGRA